MFYIILFSYHGKIQKVYEDLLDSFGPKYPQLASYLENVYDIREKWCLCYRKDLKLRGNNTNNFVEVQFLVWKDNILNRTKEVNTRFYPSLD